MITKNQINQTGYFLMKRSDAVSAREAHSILKYFRLIHQHPMSLFRHLIDRKLKKHKIDALVSQRLKRIPSIVKKLKMQKSMQLARMQDIGGLRIVVDGVSEVNLIRDEIKKVESHSKFKFTFVNEKNYIKNPQKSGYRSIHMVYKYEKNIPSEKQCRVEIQIRTKLQHSWATAVEVMGTYLNQPLKQSLGDDEYLDIFKKISKLFIWLEEIGIDYALIKGEVGADYALIKEVRQNIENIQLLEKLQNFTIVSQHLNDDSQGKYLLLKMNFKQKVIEIVRYAEAKFEQANDDYLKMEEDNNGNQAVEVVLVSIQDVKKLSQSYPNYFMDTTEFINNLKLLFQILDMQNDAYYPKDEIIKQESERISKEIFIKMTGKE